MKSILVIFMFFSLSVQAVELVVIQAVSDSKKTFITRNGQRQGVKPGITGTFTGENISVLARAKTVTGHFTQWELLNSDAILPFEKGAMVSYYAATEYLWALAPESERKKYIKTQIPFAKRSLVFKGALTRGLSESVSNASVTDARRGGYMGEIYYEKDLFGNLAFDVGLRYEQEVINYTGASLITKRNLAIIDLIYYFDFLTDFVSGGRFFLAGGLGYGLSNTSTVTLSQTGPVSLLPAMKAGISLPFNETSWEFVMDGAFESLNTSEEQEDGTIQTTTQTNFKVGFGLRRFF
jgi:hypothetical protein